MPNWRHQRDWAMNQRFTGTRSVNQKWITLDKLIPFPKTNIAKAPENGPKQPKRKREFVFQPSRKSGVKTTE